MTPTDATTLAPPSAEPGTIHMGQSIRGALMLSDEQLTGWVLDDDGKILSPDAARRAFMEELSKGREVIPYGKCDLWDFRTGCPGHPARD